MFSSLRLPLFLTISLLLSEIKSPILIIPFSASFLKYTINLLVQRMILQDRFHLNPVRFPYLPRSTLQNFLSIPHRILVALSAISAVQSYNIKLISHQQVLGSAEESDDRLPISCNKVLSAFQ